MRMLALDKLKNPILEQWTSVSYATSFSNIRWGATYSAAARSPSSGSTAGAQLPLSNPMQRESSGSKFGAHQVHYHYQLHPDTECRWRKRDQLHWGNSATPQPLWGQSFQWEWGCKKLVLWGLEGWSGGARGGVCKTSTAKDGGDPLRAQSAGSCFRCGMSWLPMPIQMIRVTSYLAEDLANSPSSCEKMSFAY